MIFIQLTLHVVNAVLAYHEDLSSCVGWGGSNCNIAYRMPLYIGMITEDMATASNDRSLTYAFSNSTCINFLDFGIA